MVLGLFLALPIHAAHKVVRDDRSAALWLRA